MEDANYTQQNHEDELKLFFDKLSVFQEGVLQNMCTVTEILDKMEESTLKGLIYQGSSQLEEFVEQTTEIENYRISNHLYIDDLESRLNTGADELAVGEMIFHSPEYLKAHLVSV